MNRQHNYPRPVNYVCAEMPSWEKCRDIRIAGCPYDNCKRYSVAFKVNEDGSAGDAIIGWAGFAYECPIIPYWDEDGKWSILQTEFLTEE